MADQPQNLRGLKALVAGMGVLIVIGVTVVAGTIIHRLYASFLAPPPMAVTEAMPQPAAPASASPAPYAVTLPPGMHIAGIAAAGPDVAVWLTGPHGDEVLLDDPQSGRIRLLLQAPPPAQK